MCELGLLLPTLPHGLYTNCKRWITFNFKHNGYCGQKKKKMKNMKSYGIYHTEAIEYIHQVVAAPQPIEIPRVKQTRDLSKCLVFIAPFTEHRDAGGGGPKIYNNVPTQCVRDGEILGLYKCNMPH